MAQQLNPNDRQDATDDDLRRSTRLEEDLQIDPELREGPMTGGRIAAFALVVVLVLGAVFYGLNASSTGPNQPVAVSPGTPPPNQSAEQNTPPVAPGVRDVTPYNVQPNAQPGVTTGAAPTQPATPPSNAPTGQQADPGGTTGINPGNPGQQAPSGR